jgi:hypothetical protein
MTPRKFVLWLIGALLVYFVIVAPGQAADALRGAVDGLHSVAISAMEFLRGLGK